jgi:hypothetical protein
VWSLLRAGRTPEAQRAAAELEAADPLTRSIAELARSADRPSPELDARIRRLPLLTPAQARAIAKATPSPPTRPLGPARLSRPPG